MHNKYSRYKDGAVYLNKEKLAREIEELVGFPKSRDFRTSKAYKATGAVFKAMADALHRGEEVRIPHFGVFYLKTMPPRKRYVTYFYGDVPKEHLVSECKEFPAKKKVGFRPSRGLIKFISEGYNE